MSQSLAIYYRPKTLDEIVEQSSTVRILKQQLQTGDLQHCYLFCGGTGSGKTTMARAFYSAINSGEGQPIEMDAASNSGVDNVRAIIKEAYERAIVGKYKIYIVDECMSGDTEILTSKGFKKFKDLNQTELVAQYCDDGTIEFVAPSKWIKLKYQGPMYDVNLRQGKGNNSKHVLMSPNHVQPMRSKKTGQIKESYIKDLKFNCTKTFIAGGLAKGSAKQLSPFDRLVIAVQADGWKGDFVKSTQENWWEVKLTKERKIQRLENILAEAGVSYNKYQYKESLNIYKFKLPSKITKNLSDYFSLDDIDGIYAQTFIEEILQWDGSLKSGYPGYYCCSNKDNVDFVAAMASLAGYAADCNCIPSKNPNHSSIYSVHWYYRDFKETSRVTKTKVENFDDYIYCVKVPSHKIVVRSDGFIFVTGNCHALSNAAWQAFLKCIEEPPAHTIFIFCTTDPQKLPATILNRMQKFNFTKISLEGIKSRLKFVCEQEGFTNYQEAIDYIARLANGCMRDALTMLDKCVDYSRDLAIQNVFEALGNFSYPDMFALINALIDGNEGEVLKRVSTISDKGSDLKLFVDQFLTFTLDLAKYALFKNMDLLQVPASFEEDVKNATNFEAPEKYYSYVVDKLLDLKNMIKGDSNITSTVEVIMLRIARCQ